MNSNNSNNYPHAQWEYLKDNSNHFKTKVLSSDWSEDFCNKIKKIDNDTINMTPKIQITDNLFDKDLLDDINFYSNLSYKNFNSISESGTNGLWSKVISTNCGTVNFFTLPNSNPLFKKIEKCLIEKIDKSIIDVSTRHPGSFTFQFYYYTPLSCIDWHHDRAYAATTTIYLNDDWKHNYGGLFLYHPSNDKEDINVIFPKQNRAITSSDGLYHATSLTKECAPVRRSIQIFYNNNDGFLSEMLNKF